jgi:hypothetical protein
MPLCSLHDDSFTLQNVEWGTAQQLAKRTCSRRLKSRLKKKKQKTKTKTKKKQTKLNSVVWVRERTIPAERPLLDGELSANFIN